MRKQTSKTTRKKAAPKKATSKKTAAKKTVAKKTTAKKAAPKKTGAKKTAAKKAVTRKAAAKKAPARRVASKKTAVQKPAGFPLDYAELRKGVLVLRALNHKFRQKIVNFLHKKGSSSVSAIHKGLKVEQSVASQHLGVLRREGILIRERRGKFMYYSLNYDRLKELASFLDKIVAD